jgi:hypothetical protein
MRTKSRPVVSRAAVSINTIKGNTIASQLGNAHILTVVVMDDVALAEV